jgi:RND family efflux transporter MFP subunit
MPKIKSLILNIKLKLNLIFAKFRALSFKKKLVVILLLIIISGLIIKVISDSKKDNGYTLAKVKIGNIDEIVSESGNIVSSNKTDIYSPSNGIVKEIFVENGDLVKRGDKLFEVQSSATEQERRAAEANYLAAISALNSAKANADSLQSSMFSQWQTFKETAESDRYENSDGTPRFDERSKAEFHVAEKNWTASEKNFKNAQTAIDSAQANVASSKLLLDATKDAIVKATADGYAENISVSKGAGVSINQVLAPAAPILTLVGDAKTEVALKLGESDVVKVKPGQEVNLDINAVKDKNYKGKVVRVDSVGTLDQGVVKYNAYIEVLNPDENLKQGMNADADVKTKSVKGVLIVPNSSVKPYQGGRAVRVVDPKTKEPKLIPVKIGLRGQSYTQILEGIEEGKEVITALSNEKIKRPGLF